MNSLMRSIRGENRGLRGLTGSGEPGLHTLLGGTGSEADGSQYRFTGGAGQVGSSSVTPAYRDIRLNAARNANNSTSGPGGGGGRGRPACVHVDSILPSGSQAGMVRVGDRMLLADGVTLTPSHGVVTYSMRETRPCFRIVTKLGASLVCSDTAPIPVWRGGYCTPPQLLGHRVPVWRGAAAWDFVTEVHYLGLCEVQHITVGDRCFWAGETVDSMILHHNAKPDTVP